MGRRSRALLGGCAVALAVGGVLSATAGADTPAPTLVELPECASPAPVAPVAGPGDTVVTFDVPAVTRLRVSGGEVVAVATNTGCAPRAGDTFVVGDRHATAPEVAAALAFRTGDWTSPGTWHSR